ncbi:Ig-like domain-containing protein [Hymenobacter seoulensis]
MKTTLRLLGAFWALLPLGAQAQGECGAASNTFNFTTAAAQDWKTRSASVGVTTFTTSGFSPTGNVATFATVGTSGIRWAADYGNQTNNTSSVTITFSRAVSNLKIVVNGIDRNSQSGNQNDYQDAVTFNGYTSDVVAPGNLISLASANIARPTRLTVAGNTVSDQSANNQGTGATTVTFPSAVKKLVLTFANTQTADNNPGSQEVAIASLSWCKLTPTAANDALTASYTASPTIDVAANDAADGSFSLDLNPATTAIDAAYTDANGITYSASAAGEIVVTNSSKFVGNAVLPYGFVDNANQKATANLSLTLTNAAPVGADYQVTRSYNTTTAINLLQNVTDADGVATISGATLDLNPALERRQATYTIANQGTFTVDDNGLVTFAASNGFVGTSTLAYTIQDEKGLVSAPKQLRLATTSVAPVAVNDAATRSNTARSVIYILSNDTDADNDIDPATVDLNPATTARETSFTDGSKGTYTVDEFGLISFAAQGTYTGTSTLSYIVRDAKGNASNAATLTLTVVQTLANNDSNVTPRNNAVSGNVLINDNNRVGTNLTVATTAVTAPTKGSVTISEDGNYTYTPNTNYVGNDSFVYRVSDGGLSSVATVNITVYDPAVACTQATGPNLLKNPGFELGNTGFQTDYIYVANQSGVTNELVPEGLYAVGTSAADYHPNFAQTGRSGNFLMINGSNTIKKLYSQTIKVEPGKYYNFSAWVNNILANTTTTTADDPVFGFVINGVATSEITSIPEAPNSWVKLSDIWFSGTNTTATFEIVNVSIVQGGNDMGIDDVYFGTCNEAPKAQDDLVLVPSIVPTTFSALDNDIDDGGIEGNSLLLFSSKAATGNGAKSIDKAEGKFNADAATGRITFTPASGFTGSTSIAYKGKDAANAESTVAAITVRVGPITADDSQDMSGSRVATLDVVSNDQDVDGVDPATVDLDPATPEQDVNRVVPNVGVYRVNSAGVVTFTPVATFAGTTTIQYSVRDFVGAPSSPSTISVKLSQPLPVELTQFDAVAKQDDALVTWTTIMEKNSDHFDIERSVDGRSFSKVGTVKGQGSTTQEHRYRFIDGKARLVGALLYYRLRQVDTDGTFQYSSVKTVKFAEQLPTSYTVGLVPNPTLGSTALDLSSLPAGTYTVDIIDVTGRVLQVGKATGGALSALDVQQFAKGVYIIKVHNAAISITQRLVKE